MSTQPQLSTRVGALERRQINLEIQVEGLSEDMTSGFRHIGEIFDQHGTHLTKINTRLDSIEARIDKIETKMGTLATKDDLAALKATVATKDDLARIEARVVDVLTQVLTLINEQRSPSQ